MRAIKISLPDILSAYGYFYENRRLRLNPQPTIALIAQLGEGGKGKSPVIIFCKTKKLLVHASVAPFC